MKMTAIRRPHCIFKGNPNTPLTLKRLIFALLFFIELALQNKSY